MPKVQAILSEYFGTMPLGVHLNGDEAVALGGAFVAANRSSAYRVKKIGAVDVSPFSITVNITSPSGCLLSCTRALRLIAQASVSLLLFANLFAPSPPHSPLSRLSGPGLRVPFSVSPRSLCCSKLHSNAP